MGQARNRGARRPLGGMARQFGLGGGARDVSRQTPRAAEAGDHGEEVGERPAMGWRPDLQEEVHTQCRRARGRTVRWLRVPRGLPQGSTR